MKIKLTASLFALAAGASFLTFGCNDSIRAQEKSDAAAAVAPKIEPTDARLKQRAAERWAKIVKNDWIAAYDYLSPDQKRVVPVAQYLQTKSHHKYENPRIEDVLLNDGANAYLRVEALWTPVHEALKHVKLDPGQTLSQDVEMLETWRFADGDWTYVVAKRPDEFYTDHPEFLKSGAKPAGSEGPTTGYADAAPEGAKTAGTPALKSGN